ncbi:hypothetical protein PFMALIP_00141 [Plasmodium falciparum MaliPS096_E11]|uniref:Uncharacterized protein n=1 Tax=Plasmodium falciparum MaliPS096_E11 TaxID=1036727 RepID=A0A024WX54_PLAFA|nr:hypothetical protein PFMALIP_00141 [Plasmodium falciparum MaliPS096_E11]
MFCCNMISLIFSIKLNDHTNILFSFIIPTVGYVITNENNYNITSNNMSILYYIIIINKE